MIQANINTQTNFSGGQINSSATRRDGVPSIETGAVLMSNFRSEGQGTALSRPGRLAVYPGAARIEFVRMSGTASYHVNFYSGQIVITDLAGTVVASNTSAAYLWTALTLTQISFVQGLFQCCVCFPGMRPQILTWAPDTGTWSFAAFSWVVAGGNNQEPFYRFSALGATMSWDSTSGNYMTVGSSLPLVCSANYFTVQMIGSVLSILGGQVQITAVTDLKHATVKVLSRLPDTVVFAGVDDPTGFTLGQIAETTTSLLKIEVIGVSGSTITGPLMSGRIAPSGTIATTADTISSPSASTSTTGFTVLAGTTKTVQWLEEFASDLRGWPAAVAYGNGRFIFCQFPQRQEAILWTSVGSLQNAYIDSLAATTDQSAGASPTSAILEFCNGKPKVLNVVDTGDEFVFTDQGVFFIPLAVSSTPLKPGSVAFRQITNDGCSPVRPVPLLASVVYLNAAGNRASVVRATGSITLPYAAQDMTDGYSDLFKSPVCIAVSAGDASPERLCYVVNSDGSLVIGKFNEASQLVGWHPETGVAPVKWVTINIASVWYATAYSGALIIEKESAGAFLDGTLTVNSPPANMVQAGKGPFWWIAGGVVTLAESGVDMGDRSIDVDGNIVELQGDVLTDAGLIGGAPVTVQYAPAIKQAQPGNSVRQRMRRRRIRDALIVVESNCEFDWGSRRVPAYDFGDDQSQAPAFRRRSIRTRVLERTYEPGIALMSSRYGQVRLMEFSAEVTV